MRGFVLLCRNMCGVRLHKILPLCLCFKNFTMWYFAGSVILLRWTLPVFFGRGLLNHWKRSYLMFHKIFCNVYIVYDSVWFSSKRFWSAIRRCWLISCRCRWTIHWLRYTESIHWSSTCRLVHSSHCHVACLVTFIWSTCDRWFRLLRGMERGRCCFFIVCRATATCIHSLDCAVILRPTVMYVSLLAYHLHLGDWEITPHGNLQTLKFML